MLMIARNLHHSGEIKLFRKFYIPIGIRPQKRRTGLWAVIFGHGDAESEPTIRPKGLLWGQKTVTIFFGWNPPQEAPRF